MSLVTIKRKVSMVWMDSFLFTFFGAKHSDDSNEPSQCKQLIKNIAEGNYVAFVHKPCVILTK